MAHDPRAENRLRHGHARIGQRTRAYKCWAGIKRRCDNPNEESYPRYGGRGITYDPRWAVFDEFLADMGEPPAGMSIERVDNDGPYCKANCRWADRKEQARNRRSSRVLTHEGRSASIAEWGERTGINPMLIVTRLRRGWPVERALTPPHQLAA